MATENLKFKDAYAQLETISTDLQNDTDDLDELIKKVKRAAELIKYCKSALSTATSEIGKVITEVEENTGSEIDNSRTEYKAESKTSSSDDDLPF